MLFIVDKYYVVINNEDNIISIYYYQAVYLSNISV